MSPKSFLESKTMWFGLGQLIFGFVGIITGWIDQQTGVALIMAGFATIGLRINTAQPIAGFMPKQ